MDSSGKIEKMHFTLFLLLGTTKNSRNYIKNKHKTLKGGEKKVHLLGTRGPKEWHTAEFSGFLFASYMSQA